MRSLFATVLGAALFALSTATFAQAQAADPEHAEHHPPGASAPASAPAASTKQQPPKAAPSGKTMNSMQDMHARMMAAKTVEERQALMAEHMKAMQDGMATMGRMKGDKDRTSPEAMGQRMDMMEMMMQMMMDREAARTPATR